MVVSHSAYAKLQKAFALHQGGRLLEAKAQYQAVLKIQPKNFDALHLLGVVTLQTGDPQGACDWIARALAIQPNSAQAHCNLGLALRQCLLLDAAVESYQQALRIRPDYADAHYNLGNVLDELDQPESALSCYRQALHYNPKLTQAHCNQGLVLTRLGQVEAALACYDQALCLQPSFANAHFNKGVALLLAGDFSAGWPLYEWRWHPEAQKLPARQFNQALWLGEQPLRGKTLLIHAEQGLGDSLQFCRYVPILQSLGARVVLEVPAPLLRLLEPLVDTIVESGKDLPTFDLHCPLMSLPLALKTFSVSDIPVAIPYLHASADLVQTWATRLSLRTKPRIGLAWSGRFRAQQPQLWGINARRNMTFAQFAQFNHPGFDFYSLQKGNPEEKILNTERLQHWSSDNLHIFTEYIDDFADTAALIHHLDLLICVDTSVAHLAAAMGKPVWLLNRFDTCWRWLLGREDSPWYPTLRIFRQPKLGDWNSVINAVQVALQGFLKSSF